MNTLARPTAVKTSRMITLNDCFVYYYQNDQLIATHRVHLENPSLDNIIVYECLMQYRPDVDYAWMRDHFDEIEFPENQKSTWARLLKLVEKNSQDELKKNKK